MAKDIRLPQLGQTMEEGTIVTSLVKVGDKVGKGDVIFEIETDKATLEMESPAEGFVNRILIEVGETVAVNTPILILGAEGEELSAEYIDSLMSEVGAGAAAPATDAVAAQSPAPAQEPASAPAAPAAPEGVKVVRLPQLGQTMEEGTIVNAFVGAGDKVDKGDVIFEIETDKATLEMESPSEGFVNRILVEIGETVPVNTPIMLLGAEGREIGQDFIDSLKAGGAAAPQTAAPRAEITSAEPAVETPKAPGGRIFASPRARTVAAELGVDMHRVRAAAGAARITEADVRRAAASGAAKGPGGPEPKYNLGDKVPVKRLQKIVAERMLKSKQEIPCFYLNVVVDMTDIVKLRSQLNKTGDIKISFNDFLIRALAIGLEHYPIMTGQLAGDYIQLADRIDIGLAISTPEGLAAPLIRDANNKTVRQIAEYSKGLIERAQSNKLTLDDLEGGCITVSNLGGFGIDSFIAIVVPGQCSILGVGRIADTCMPIDDNIVVRKMMNLNLSVDHKVANGADAAQFLDYVKKMLEHTSTFE